MATASERLSRGKGRTASERLVAPGGKANSRTAAERLGKGVSKPGTDIASQIDPNGNPITSSIWETAKGAGRGLIDLVGRSNFAVAGAAEELFSPQGGGLGAVPGRVASEIFSGIGNVKGQKEGFAQVMEQAGAGEMGKLSDVLGFAYSDTGEGLALKRGGILDPTGRGAIGLFGDIFLDPTTYLTAGGSATGKFLTQKGLKYLSPEGKKVAAEAWKAVEPEFKAALAIPEASARVSKVREIDQAFRSTVLGALESNPALLQKTGLKWAGMEVVSPESLRGLTDIGKRAVLSAPGGAKIAKGVEAMGRGIQRAFDPYADLAGLPTEARDAMKGLLRENRSAAAMHKTVLDKEWDGVAKAYQKLARSYGKGEAGVQALGKKFTDWRQGAGGLSALPRAQDGYVRLYRGQIGEFGPASAGSDAGRWFSTDPGWADTYVKLGKSRGPGHVLYVDVPLNVADASSPGAHHWMNETGKFLDPEWANRAAPLAAKGALTASELDVFQKITKIYDEMEPILVREGVLTPEQVAQHSGKYLHQVWKNADEALAETAERKGRPLDRIVVNEQMQRARIFDTVQEGVEISRSLRKVGMEQRLAGARGKVYGELVPEYDVVKNLADYIQQSTDAIWRKRTYDEARERFGLPLDEAFDPGRTYALDQARRVRPDVRSAIDAVAEATEAAEFRDFSVAKNTLAKLSDQERRELVRELVSRSKSASQIVNIERELGDALMPSVRVTKPGMIDPYYTKYGQDGTLHTVHGGLWGDKPIQLPAQIIKMVENAPGDFIKDAARKRGLVALVKGFDKYNNLFKAMTYPFYPSGAVRDTYNNVMQAYLGVGVGAFARPFQAGRVLRGSADDVLRLGDREFTAKELNTMAKDFGVIDPSGAAYVQFTGDEGAKRAGPLSRARAVRGSVDNLTRSQLFINNIAAGMTPQDAAQVVKDFLFDYSELSAWDKDFMRRAVPFYVFPRKAIESYGRAVVKTPGRVANLAKPFRGREDENNAMTKWEGDGFKVRLDRNGKDITVLNGVDLPVKTMDLLWAGSPVKTMNRWLAMSSPAIKVPYEIVSGQDPFRGQPLGRQQSYFLGPLLEDMPKPLQDWAGYQKTQDAAGRPKYTVRMDKVQVLAEAALISRILSMGERNVREQAKDPSWTARMLDFMTGLRLKNLNLDEQKKLKWDSTFRMLEEEAVKQGELGRGTYTFKPKGQ